MKVAAHQVEELDHQRIAQRIEDLIAGLARDDDLPRTQYGEVLGEIGLLEAKVFDKIGDGQFAMLELFKDGDTRRVRERLEDFSLKVSQGVRHVGYYMRRFAYSSVVKTREARKAVSAVAR